MKRLRDHRDIGDAIDVDALSIAVVEPLNPRRELVGAFVIGDGHHGDFRFRKAVAAGLRILIGEFEIGELSTGARMRRSCRGRVRRAGVSYGGCGMIGAAFPDGGALAERAEKSEPLDRDERADAEWDAAARRGAIGGNARRR